MANRCNDAKRAQVAAMFATGATQTDICARHKISRVTLWEWRKDPKFLELVHAETLEFQRETRELAKSMRDNAWKTMRKILRSKNHAAAMRAASEILHTLGALRPPDKHVDAAVKKFVVKFANLPGAKDD